jgi:hypothetical protein
MQLLPRGRCDRKESIEGCQEARWKGSLLVRNPLRHLCVLSVSAVSLFEHPFTAEAQSSRRMRREKSNQDSPQIALVLAEICDYS